MVLPLLSRRNDAQVVGRRWAISLRQRCLQRRPALLGLLRSPPLSNSLLAHRERHQVFGERLGNRKPIFRALERYAGHVAKRGPDHPADDERWHAPSHTGPSWPRRR